MVDDREPHPITSVAEIEPPQALGDRYRDRLLEDLLLGAAHLLQQLDVTVDDRVRPVAHLLQIGGHLAGGGGVAATTARSWEIGSAMLRC